MPREAQPSPAFPPRCLDHVGENPRFHADISITYPKLTPARKHFEEVLKRLGFAHIGSKRMAHYGTLFSGRRVYSMR